MLKVIEYGKEEYEFPALIVLGCFDAIHLGHRELIKKAKLQAKINGLDLGVMMFREGKGGKLVYSFDERVAMLEEFNVKFVVAIDYNDQFKATAPLDFLAVLEDKINVKAYMSGKDFRFGADAKGKSSTLKNYAEDEENGVWYMPIKEIDYEGERVSTTLIKSCLEEGQAKKAAALLGAEFSVSGEVVKGTGRGTSVVGFPTVNIEYPDWKQPLKHGVYSVKSTIDEVEYDGVANYGNCPTFDDDRIAIEVYFEKFKGDLYGKVLTVRFVDYLRDIKKFEGAEGLSEQLKEDVKVAANDKPQEIAPVEKVEKEQPEQKEKVAEVKPVVAETNTPAPAVVEENKTELTADEKKQAFINSLEEDFEVDMSLIRALPPLEEEKKEEEVPVVEETKKEQIQESAEINFAGLDSGFDDVSDDNKKD